MDILELKELTVKINGNIILENVDLLLEDGQNYILFGPNGSGKTTLVKTIMGIPPYEIVSGKILFLGEDVTKKSIVERSKLKISVAFQNPPDISGVKLSDLLKICLNKDIKDEFDEFENELIDRFKLTKFLDRDINVGFSGGEKKRAEIIQMLFLKPKLMILDEPDSGVDVESLRLLSTEIQRYVESNGSSALIITHKGDVLDYIKSEHACVLLNKNIYCFENPRSIYRTIKTAGYEKCLECKQRITEGWDFDKK
jgi:Fe-S cluster assembly ATP-binding protein